MEKKNEVEQLDMGLKEPASNKFKHFKYKTELFFTKLRTSSVFTAPFMWISCAFAVALIFTQYYYYKNFFEFLPKEIPLFLTAKTPDLKLVEKEILLVFLVLSIIVALFSVVLAVKNYYRFRIISMFVMTNLVLGILLLTISIIKIFGIYIF